MSDYLLEPVILESVGKMPLPKIDGLGKSLSSLLKRIPAMILDLGNRIKTNLMQRRVESELNSRISTIQPPDDFHTQVFDNEADQQYTLVKVKGELVRDIKRNGTIKLNEKTYTNTLYVRQIAGDVFQRLSKDAQAKISEKDLRDLLAGFKGDVAQLQTVLYDAFGQLDLNEKQRLLDVVRGEASEYAVNELINELVKIVFPDSENGSLTPHQEKALRSVLFQCYQSSMAPLCSKYTPYLFGTLAGMSIEQNGERDTIVPVGVNSASSEDVSDSSRDPGTVIIQASRGKGVSVRSSRSLVTNATAHGNPVILADYIGVMKTRFAFRENVLTPISATADLRLTGIRFNELARLNARLVSSVS